MKEKMSKELIECKLRYALKIIYYANREESAAFDVFKKKNIRTPGDMNFFGIQELVREYMMLLSDYLSCDFCDILIIAKNYALCMDLDDELSETFEEDFLLTVDRIYRNQTECDDDCDDCDGCY